MENVTTSLAERDTDPGGSLDGKVQFEVLCRFLENRVGDVVKIAIPSELDESNYGTNLAKKLSEFFCRFDFVHSNNV